MRSDRRLDGRGLADPLADPRDHDADSEPDEDSAHPGDEEVAGRLHERERPRDDRGDRHAVGDERRRVVHETLALEDRDDRLRDREVARHAERRDGVGRRDDRSEHEGRGPRELGHERVRDDRDGGRRREDEPDREERDREEVAPEVAVGARERRPVEERRDEDEEDRPGVELGPRHAGHARDDDACRDEERRQGEAERARDDLERCGDGEEDEDELDDHGPLGNG